MLDRDTSPLPTLKKFLGSSVQFRHVISPIARTHAAFVSIFTGKDPSETGVRDNISIESLNTDKILDNSLIHALKKNGYETVFMIDETRFSNFKNGNVFSQTQAPTNTFMNFISPIYMRSILFFGLFNNPVGYFLFPEISRNQSYSFAYKLRYFTADVIAKINELNLSSKPFALFVHTCALHIPGSFHYPYYLKNASSNSDQKFFNYGDSALNIKKLYRPTVNRAISDDKQIYENGVRQVYDEFIEPILSYLERSNVSENSTIILGSDHGEAIGSLEKFPYFRYPTHGAGLLFSDDSNQSFLAIKSPGLTPIVHNELFSLKNLIPALLSVDSKKSALRSPEKKPVFAETGLSITYMFSGQSAIFPISVTNMFAVDEKDKFLYFKPEYTQIAMLQKQRAVFWKNYRLTLYATIYGYKYFICNLSESPTCREPATQVSAVDKALLFSELDKFIRTDTKSGFLPTLDLKIRDSKLKGRIEWLNENEFLNNGDIELQSATIAYQRALELMNHYLDPKSAASILLKILKNPKTQELLKVYVEALFYEICDEGQVLKLYSNNIKNLEIAYVTKNIYIERPFAQLSRAKCLKKLNITDDKQVVSTIVDAKEDSASSVRLQSQIDEFFSANKPDSALREKIFADDQFPYFSTSFEARELLNKFLKHSTPSEFLKFEKALKTMYADSLTYELDNELWTYQLFLLMAANSLNDKNYLAALLSQQATLDSISPQFYRFAFMELKKGDNSALLRNFSDQITHYNHLGPTEHNRNAYLDLYRNFLLCMASKLQKSDRCPLHF